MKTLGLIKSSWWMTVGLTLVLASPLAMAQPDRHPQGKPHYSSHDKGGNKHYRNDRDHKAARPHYNPPRYNQKSHPKPAAPVKVVHHTKVVHHAPPPRPHYRALPRDVSVIRHDVYQHRHHIKRGPTLPRHVHVVRGKPLPHHYGRVLAYEHHHYLPYYEGYEWRSAGRDLILVAAATGIVYTILDNVLN